MIAIEKKNRHKRRSRAASRDNARGVRFATEEEGRRLFEYQVQKELGITGDEFLARWDAEEYRDLSDPSLIRKVERLWMLIPFGRRTQR